MIGRTLSHYRILKKIGAGGMGEIYVAEDQKLGRQVALKVLPSEMASSVRQQRFEQEAKAVAALNHPNIVTLFSIEEDEGVHFITMELVNGRTLSELIPSWGMPIRDFYGLAIALADAVSAAHQKGIVHRDLKPDNLMQDSDRRLKILDFGLAKWKQDFLTSTGDALNSETQPGDPPHSMTREGRIVGTVAYMSPEQAAGRPIDPRSDIFSIGIILFEMATGQRPFSGDTTVMLASSIIKDDAPSVTDLNPALPPLLARVINRCLTKDPEHRYQTAKDIRNELEQLKLEHDSGSSSSDAKLAVRRAKALPGAAFRVAASWMTDARDGVRALSWTRRLWMAAGILSMAGLTWALWLAADLAQRPSPTGLEPNGDGIVWGHRILLKWEPPPADGPTSNAFEVEVRQGNRIGRYDAFRNQYPLFPIDEGFTEGEFEWRVRATDPESNWSTRHTVTFFTDRVSRIQKRGVLRVGLFADELPPYAYVARSAPDGVDGIEVRLARIVARELEQHPDWTGPLKIEFERGEWFRGNIEDLKADRADIVFANTSGTSEREEVHNVRFSTPYLETGLAFVWRRRESVSDWTDLVEKRVAVWVDSTTQIVLDEYGATPRQYTSTSQMYEALGNGEVDAILDDEFVMRCELKNPRYREYELQLFKPEQEMELPFVYPERIAAYLLNDGSGERLLELVNEILKRPDMKREILEMMEEFLAAPDCKPTH